MLPFPPPAQDGPPFAALLFRPGPGLAPEAHRVARALLQDAARHRGGRVSAEGDGTWRLVAAPPALEMARRALSAVLNGRDAALVTEAVAAPAAPPPRAADPGPEAILAALPLASLLERRPILGFGPGGAPRPAGVRVLPSPGAVAQAVGPRWAGAPWQAHGRDIVARRAAAAPVPAGTGEGALHLDLPPDALGLVAGASAGGVPVLPILPPRALARPPAVPFGLAGPPAAAMAMLDPARLPGLALHLPRDPLLDSLPAAFWQAIGPARVVLEGVADAAAMEWGLARGIARFAGPWAERLLAARRRG